MIRFFLLIVSGPRIADINIEIARGEEAAGTKTQGDVAVAGAITERSKIASCITIAADVVEEVR